MNIAEKLKRGDEIRIISPSRSAKILSEDGIKQATETLEKLGFVVTFGQHIFETDLHNSSSISARVTDLHDAFLDKNVKGILTVIGGFNSNEILPYLDYEMIAKNPKVICGYSDITALTTAITHKCNFITYSGPHFSSFQMEKEQQYQTDNFLNCVANNEPFFIIPSKVWSDDLWFLDQENRSFFTNDGLKVYNPGSIEGTVYGGNLCTLNLLQGTEYMPNLENTILFIEDDELTYPEAFARDLTSLLQTTRNIKGLIIGRFQLASKMTEEQLTYILDKQPLLKTIPVMYDGNFGHTQPILTFPIGGKIRIDTENQQIKVIEF